MSDPIAEYFALVSFIDDDFFFGRYLGQAGEFVNEFLHGN